MVWLLASLLILTGVSTILTVDKLPAPARVICPPPTVTIISEPLLVVVGAIPPAMLSVEFSLKPDITSKPSPALYLISAPATS